MSEWKYNNKKYTFITDMGLEKIRYVDYMNNQKLRDLVLDPDNYRLFLGETIIAYTPEHMRDNILDAKNFFSLENAQKDNPLQFFAPSGIAKEFINDYDHSLTGIFSGNRFGKTTSAFIKTIINSIPCDPSWKIFTEHGIEYKKFRGPKVVAIASYEWGNHKTTIWPQVVRKWLPKSELGEYAYGGSRKIAWKDIPPRVELACGTIIYFYAYSQDQAAFESQAVDIWLWDEQGHESLFDGANERCRTLNGWHVLSLTPHKLPGRPDTGAGGWITKLADGRITKGHSIKFYTGNLLESVPDWIYPEKQKQAAYIEWVKEPTDRNDVKKLKEGQARLYGIPQQSSGLVYDDWDPLIHIIDPFPIKSYWTRYRAIDYGRKAPTACLYAAVDEEGTLYITDEYYETNKLIHESARGIVEKGGNRLQKVVAVNGRDDGFCYDKFKEVGPVNYRATVFDSRSFSVPDHNTNMTISQLYNIYGLYVSKASGKNAEETVPIAKEWLRVDFSKNHKFTGAKGAPKVYIFSTCVNFIREISEYVYEEDSNKNNIIKEKPRGGNDHAMDAFRYLVQIPPLYVGEEREGRRTYKKKLVVDKYGGY